MRQRLANEIGGKYKEKVYGRYKEVLNDKTTSLQNLLQDLGDSVKNETKSSAGDKYETSRAMLQIEQDNVRMQLKEALEQKAMFEKIDVYATFDRIAMGSLVKTERGYFFLSVALGKIQVDEHTVIALSPQSLLGKQLKGMKVFETITVNGINYTIESIE